MAESAASLPRGTFRRFIGVASEPGPYLSLVYLLLGLPLGVGYFVFLTTGLSLGIGLSLIWIGLPILALTVLAAYGLAGFERQLAIYLLGETIPPMRPRAAGPEGAWLWLKNVFSAATTWKGLLYLLLKFPLGLASWLVAIVLLAVSLALVFAPATLAFGGRPGFPFWEVDTLVEALFCTLLGLVLGIASLHAFRALGFAWGKLSALMLGMRSPGASHPPVRESK